MDPLSLVAIGGKLLDKLAAFFPTPEDKLKAQLALLEMQQRGELAHLTVEFELAKGQLDINKEDAKSDSPIQRNWRPMLGWVCVSAYAFQFVLAPLITYVAVGFFDHSIIFPKLDLTELGALLFGMLGLGVMRSAEKIKGA
jgi:hypothetical protein